MSTAATMPARPINSPGQVLFASLIGTTIEFFDFYIYATAAVLVFPRLFFPAADPASATLASLATFAVAFVARPIGSAFFGHFGDRIGRKAPLVAALRLRGHPIALPRVVGHQLPLALHIHLENAPLKKGGFGLFEPESDWPLAVPAVVIVPLLAFDRSGNRLGYGAGYYDRTLAALRARHAVTAVGYAYAGQELTHVPHHDGDQTLDWVVTELCARKLASAV